MFQCWATGSVSWGLRILWSKAHYMVGRAPRVNNTRPSLPGPGLRPRAPGRSSDTWDLTAGTLPQIGYLSLERRRPITAGFQCWGNPFDIPFCSYVYGISLFHGKRVFLVWRKIDYLQTSHFVINFRYLDCCQALLLSWYCVVYHSHP